MTTTPTSVTELLLPPRHRLYRIFRHIDLRPPIIEEMTKDIEHVIRSQAKFHSDQSCPMLNEDELVQEGWRKLATLNTTGRIERLPTRKDFFSFFRTSVNNYFMGMVHRYRGTQKRTGKKIPEKLTVDTALRHMKRYLGAGDLTVDASMKRDVAFYVCCSKVRRPDLKVFGFETVEETMPDGKKRRRYTDEDLAKMRKIWQHGEQLVQGNLTCQDMVDTLMTLYGNAESNKPSEFSLDNEEIVDKVESVESFYDVNPEGGERSGGRPIPVSESQFVHDLKTFMSPLQCLILEMVNTPSDEAQFLSQLYSMRGCKPGSISKMDLRHCHMAEALGIDIATFEQNFENIQQKTREFMDKTDLSPEESAFTSTVRKLADHFQVQIPQSYVQNRKDIVRRCLTIAARINNTKVTEEVSAMLSSVGAKAPESCNAQLSCYGVLYDKHDTICTRCSLNSTCAAEAINAGLTIRLSPKLLGARGTKVASVLPKSARAAIIPDGAEMPDSESPQQTSSNSERDDAILSHLEGNYGKTKFHTDFYYRHKDRLTGGKIKFIFFLKNGPGPVRLRFCDPSDDLKGRLMKIKNGCYLPDTVTSEQAAELIDQHAQETFQ
jgi:hypothetical protein